jgi:hypothetical protein
MVFMRNWVVQKIKWIFALSNIKGTIMRSVLDGNRITFQRSYLFEIGAVGIVDLMILAVVAQNKSCNYSWFWQKVDNAVR